MEINIKIAGSKLLIEKVDNGILVYEIDENDSVTSKLVYSIYYEDGILDLEAIGEFLMEMLNLLRIPNKDLELNAQLGMFISKLDASKPFLGEEDIDEKNTDDDDDM